MTAKRRLIVSSTSGSNFTDAAEIENISVNKTFLQDDGKTLSQDSFFEVKTVGITPDDDMMAKFYSILMPNSKLLIEGIVDRETGQALAIDLKIQGFLDIMAAKDPSTGERFIVCQKPNWEVGATAAVTIASTGAKWKMDTNDLGESDLIDEDSLIDKNFEVPAPNDCGEASGGGKKRACANCSCGLAETEAAEKIAEVSKGTIEEKIIKASSCGGCSRGDAFRCAGCPFLGKPAFEPGTERVVLAMGDDDF